MKQIIEHIKSKQPLNYLDDDFVKGLVLKYFEKHGAVEFNKKSKQYRIMFKEIRRQLQKVYGIYKPNYKKREELLHKLNQLLKTKRITDKESLELHKQLLSTHLSTKERLPYYNGVYKSIFNITGKPKSILDLGCGLNPLSLPWMDFNGKYYASELAKKDADFLQDYFKVVNIDYAVFKSDLLKANKLPKTDVCFLFKVLESLESIERNVSEKLIKSIPARFIVVSFSTRAAGGRVAIRKRGRSWFRRIVKRLGYGLKSVKTENELFYIIEK